MEQRAEGCWSGLGLVPKVLFYGSILRTGVSVRPCSPHAHGSCEVIVP